SRERAGAGLPVGQQVRALASQKLVGTKFSYSSIAVDPTGPARKTIGSKHLGGEIGPARKGVLAFNVWARLEGLTHAVYRQTTVKNQKISSDSNFEIFLVRFPMSCARSRY